MELVTIREFLTHPENYLTGCVSIPSKRPIHF
ncbi:Uncharacterised protein [Yersinia aldovae]|nr:Uncharacterised protein [Yersinia aldovae]